MSLSDDDKPRRFYRTAENGLDRMSVCWIATSSVLGAGQPTVMWDIASANWYREQGWSVQEFVPSTTTEGAVLTDEERRVVVPILDGALQRWALTDDERRTLRGARNRLANGGQ